MTATGRTTESDGLDAGVAGTSARRESERRRQRRLEQREARSGLAKLFGAVLGPSRAEQRSLREEHNWATGAAGEQMLATSLAKRCPDVLLLNDRAMPGSRANIDHIAVAASGVYVIDAKRYTGRIEVRNPLFGPEKLKIKGRDRTRLIEGLEKQVAVVEELLASEAPVHGCLCFLPPEGFMADSGLPVIRTLRVKGFPLYYPRRLAKRLGENGPLSRDQVRAIYDELAKKLLSA